LYTAIISYLYQKCSKEKDIKFAKSTSRGQFV